MPRPRRRPSAPPAWWSRRRRMRHARCRHARGGRQCRGRRRRGLLRPGRDGAVPLGHRRRGPDADPPRRRQRTRPRRARDGAGRRHARHVRGARRGEGCVARRPPGRGDTGAGGRTGGGAGVLRHENAAGGVGAGDPTRRGGLSDRLASRRGVEAPRGPGLCGEASGDGADPAAAGRPARRHRLAAPAARARTHA